MLLVAVVVRFVSQTTRLIGIFERSLYVEMRLAHRRNREDKDSESQP